VAFIRQTTFSLILYCIHPLLIKELWRNIISNFTKKGVGNLSTILQANEFINNVLLYFPDPLSFKPAFMRLQKKVSIVRDNTIN